MLLLETEESQLPRFPALKETIKAIHKCTLRSLLDLNTTVVANRSGSKLPVRFHSELLVMLEELISEHKNICKNLNYTSALGWTRVSTTI